MTWSPKNLSSWKLWLAHGFLVPFLFLIVFMPIVNSGVGSLIPQPLVYLANTLRVNISWEFFSPNPTPIVYLEYEVEDGPDDLMNQSFVYPERPDSRFLQFYLREYYWMQMSNGDPGRTVGLFVPWLCRKLEGVKAVSLQITAEKLPSLAESQLRDGFRVRRKKTNTRSETFDCEQVIEDQFILRQEVN